MSECEDATLHCDASLCEATGGRLADTAAYPYGCRCQRGYHHEPGRGCMLDTPEYDCDAFFCPLPEGANCDPEASACAAGHTCCTSGRADPATPTCPDTPQETVAWAPPAPPALWRSTSETG
ncbi:MAG: hypothetical protein OEY14_09175 [Myxococcales bacterium]|nr:hypothetical protein [Myxococcales bacterium]